MLGLSADAPPPSGPALEARAAPSSTAAAAVALEAWAAPPPQAPLLFELWSWLQFQLQLYSVVPFAAAVVLVVVIVVLNEDAVVDVQ